MNKIDSNTLKIKNSFIYKSTDFYFIITIKNKVFFD